MFPCIAWKSGNECSQMASWMAVGQALSRPMSDLVEFCIPWTVLIPAVRASAPGSLERVDTFLNVVWRSLWESFYGLCLD